MKKKVLLIVLAGVLVVSLAVGGTFMLLTAQSHTAKNVVILGSGIDADLLETGDGNEEPTSDGIEYIVVPNQEISKVPYVVRTDGDKATSASDAYVKVVATFNNLPNVTIDSAFIDAIFIDIGANWTYEIEQDDDEKEFVTFYYVKSKPNGALETLPPLTDGDPSATTPIFETLKMPNPAGKDLNDVALYTGDPIEIELTAFLIQSDNNPYSVGDPYAKAFEQFA
jgi:hypothetical protein